MLGAIAAVMSLVSDDKSLLSSFDDLDCSSASYLKHKLMNRRYKLAGEASHAQYVRLYVEIIFHSHSASLIESDPRPKSPRQAGVDTNSPQSTTLKIGKPVRPVELRLCIAVLSAVFFPALLIALAILFAKSLPYGKSRMHVCSGHYEIAT
jgi:hypothetical protein